MALEARRQPFGRSLVLLARDDATGGITGLRAFMAWQYLVEARRPWPIARWTRPPTRRAAGWASSRA